MLMIQIDELMKELDEAVGKFRDEWEERIRDCADKADIREVDKAMNRLKRKLLAKCHYVVDSHQDDSMVSKKTVWHSIEVENGEVVGLPVIDGTYLFKFGNMEEGEEGFVGQVNSLSDGWWSNLNMSDAMLRASIRERSLPFTAWRALRSGSLPSDTFGLKRFDRLISKSEFEPIPFPSHPVSCNLDDRRAPENSRRAHEIREAFHAYQMVLESNNVAQASWALSQIVYDAYCASLMWGIDLDRALQIYLDSGGIQSELPYSEGLFPQFIKYSESIATEFRAIMNVSNEKMERVPGMIAGGHIHAAAVAIRELIEENPNGIVKNCPDVMCELQEFLDFADGMERISKQYFEAFRNAQPKSEVKASVKDEAF